MGEGSYREYMVGHAILRVRPLRSVFQAEMNIPNPFMIRYRLGLVCAVNEGK
jgi:hypothetical protein